MPVTSKSEGLDTHAKDINTKNSV